MFDDLHLPLRRLPEGGVLRVPDGLGRAIVCLEGSLWITVDDDLRDVVLAAGESHVFNHPGRALVSAFEPSALLVLELGAQHVVPAALPPGAVAR